MTANRERLKALSMWADARSNIVKDMRARVSGGLLVSSMQWPNLTLFHFLGVKRGARQQMLKNNVVGITDC